ncbi:uncharacterized protein LOC129944868 [Eupeodes corollae]|uniref:uncharacterized protein LOC129944868 n=1 Tax=Eupeodes corollae TaxID=290404 RepID=UPI0024906185|nr:uncharacterized protein LOC129944868 [Eupeodes corollae]
MITSFYNQSEIFITGGSGVVGKAAIEKLLRSCDVKFIYVLLRSKYGKSAQSRLDDLKSSRIFRVLKELKPNELDKLVLIPGDTTQDGLGISLEDRNLLKNVSVFFHSAATTRFDEPLRSAVAFNVKSTLESLKLAETFRNLKIFVHISTFYCNPFVDHLKPEIYPGVFDWRTSLKLLDSTDDELNSTLAPITDKLITGFPNTYVFTKHLSEQLVNDYRSKLPVCIFRPSIVVAALEEPEPGFTETMTGVMGLFVVWGTGLIKVLMCRKKIVMDFSALDISNKLLLMFTVKASQLKREEFEEQIPICLSSSKGLLDHTMGDIGRMISKLFRENACEKSFWIPNLTMTECTFIFWIYTFVLQLLPAFILDILMRLFRQKPIFMKFQRKIYVNAQALKYFLCTGFSSDGTTDFYKYLETGKGTEFDISAVEKCCENDEAMEEVLRRNVKGTRKFLLNEDDSSLPRCRKILEAIADIKFKFFWLISVVFGFIRCEEVNFENKFDIMTTEFYKDLEIFITGGTGVIGKAAIEKLFRSCNVKRIYVLVRPKKNVSPEDRLSEIKKSKIFRVLKENKPNELDKLAAIPGDITLDNLGISEEHRSMLKNVSIFIHSAASTHFNLPLRTAINYNLKSTYEALRLAETFLNLKLFLHVSTFFCNPSVAHLEDKVYPPVFDWRTALKLLESEYDGVDDVFDAIQNKVMTEFPNTYIFTKNLAEKLVNDHRHKLPVAIFRPSIVMAALREPEPGFTETMIGVMGLLSIWGTGLIQVILCKPKIILDVIPLDACTNFMLIFVERTSKQKRDLFLEKTPVGTVSSWGVNRHTFGKMGKYMSKLTLKNPLEKSVWIPDVRLTSCPFIFWVYTYLLQLLPAVIMDALLKLFGQKPFMMKIQRQLYYTTKTVGFFLNHQFASDGVTDFHEIIKISKGTEFDVSFFEHCCEGEDGLNYVLEENLKACRKFLLNEDDSTIPRCRKILKVKQIIYTIIRLYALYVIGSFVFRRIFNTIEV